jgi:regulator of RNase E activity RraA
MECPLYHTVQPSGNCSRRIPDAICRGGHGNGLTDAQVIFGSVNRVVSRLLGDVDSVVVLPRTHEDAILAAAQEIDTMEQQSRAALSGGQGARRGAASLGYHCLQSRKP